MRLFDGIINTHRTQGAFYKALQDTIIELDAEWPGKRNDATPKEIRLIAARYHLPVGGEHFIDPIFDALRIARMFKNTNAVRIITAFQLAWEHYQMVCKAEGRITA
jgi:hypothetical protein